MSKTYRIDGRSDLGVLKLHKHTFACGCSLCELKDMDCSKPLIHGSKKPAHYICSFDTVFIPWGGRDHTETDEHLRDAVSILSRIVHDFGPCLSNVKYCQIAEECMIHKVKLPCPIGDAGDFLRRFG